MHVMEKTIASSNWMTNGGNVIKEAVSDLLEGIGFVHSIVISL